MRSLLVLLCSLTAILIAAQEMPVQTPEVHRGPDCDLPIPPMVRVPVHTEVSRLFNTLKDHVVLFVSGDVLLSGDCNTGSLDLGLERLVDNNWHMAVPLPDEIPYCVPPNTAWERMRMDVDVAGLLGRRIKRKDRMGIWRIVIRDVEGKPIAGQAFQLTRK